MKERPILFSGAMVRAILDGRKTQTRRVIVPQPYMVHNAPMLEVVAGDLYWPMSGPGFDKMVASHYGRTGDRLWVRETWRPWWDEDPPEGTGLYCVVQYKADNAIYKPGTNPAIPDIPDEVTGHRFAMACDMAPVETWRPSIHMPRWASRLTLEVTDVRVQRVQEISEADAVAEGVRGLEKSLASFDDGTVDSGLEFALSSCPTMAFEYLWGSINGKRGYSWDANPWVWAITFKVLEGKR